MHAVDLLGRVRTIASERPGLARSLRKPCAEQQVEIGYVLIRDRQIARAARPDEIRIESKLSFVIQPGINTAVYNR